MAEEKKGCCEDQFNVMNGFQFGFGFFLANLTGLLIVGVLAWGFLLLGRYFGWGI